METTKETLMESFRRRGAWMKHFDQLNNFFVKDKLRVILDAKTISVALSCIKLIDTFGFCPHIIFHDVTDAFTGDSDYRISSIIDLSNHDAFLNSIRRVELVYAEKTILGIANKLNQL